MKPVHHPPDAILRAYADLLDQVFLFLRARSHDKGLDPKQLFDLADAMHNISAILADYGGSFQNLMKTTTYITHWGYRPLVAAARDEFFPAPPYPANTLVVVQGLAEPHFLVEIEGIAVLD